MNTWTRRADGHYVSGRHEIRKVAPKRWVRDGVAYRTLADAKAQQSPLGRRRITERTPIDWDELVRQEHPPTLPAEVQRASFVVDTAWGERLHGGPGDWRVGSGDDVWVVGKAEFAATYVQVGPGSYCKTGWALVKRMPEPFVVVTREGRVDGDAGDYLLEGPLGERWRLAAAKYASRGYVPVDQLPDDAAPPPRPYPEWR